MRYEGLLENAASNIPTDVLTALETAFDQYRSSYDGYRVLNAGRELLAQFEQETLLAETVISSYQEQLCSIFEVAKRKAAPRESFCCDHHKNKYIEVCKWLTTRLSEYLNTLLDVVPSSEIIGQLPILRDTFIEHCKNQRLSRFIPLPVFMKEHLNLDKASIDPTLYKDEQERICSMFSPYIPTRARQVELHSLRDVLRGKIGFYRFVEGVEADRAYYCQDMMVFSTFKKSIEQFIKSRGLDRSESPDKMLLALGVLFQKDVRWIEVSYNLSDVDIRYRQPEYVAAIPTAIEARGSWAFRVDRNNGVPVHGYTRDLRDNNRGLPEIVHDPMDVRRLKDAVVWSKPTQASWGINSCMAEEDV